jgi:serine/threonine-protein kinase HipA
VKFLPTKKIRVVLDLEGTRREMGMLAWSSDERRAYFEYASDFIATPLLMSPFRLPVRAGLTPPNKAPDDFGGLHGLFNDSVPDGWGRLLLDRLLDKLGVKPSDVTPLDRLSAVGTTGMGALTFQNYPRRNMDQTISTGSSSKSIASKARWTPPTLMPCMWLKVDLQVQDQRL